MITVVVPVFNGSHVLPTTLPAVTNLRGVGEIVYVDDGSSDGTPGLLAAADGIRTVTLPENRGRSAARNAGVAAARGDVMVFFDADVEPPPTAAAALAGATHGAVAAVARLDPVLDAPGDPFQDYVGHHSRGPSKALSPGDRVGWRFFLSGTCAVRRDVLIRAGGFPEGIEYGEDVTLACRLASTHPDGLRLADATVRLHDVGRLDRALGHAAAFGEAAARFDGACPSGALDRFRQAGAASSLASLAVPVLRTVVDALGPGPVRRRAVRYLLASTALRAARRA